MFADGVVARADTGKQWDPKLCKVAKFTCGLLESHMHPDVAQVAGNQEEVVFFLTQPGSVVALHNGGSNTRLNVHIGLLNLEGSSIEVAGEGWWCLRLYSCSCSWCSCRAPAPGPCAYPAPAPSAPCAPPSVVS